MVSCRIIADSTIDNSAAVINGGARGKNPHGDPRISGGRLVRSPRKGFWEWARGGMGGAGRRDFIVLSHI